MNWPCACLHRWAALPSPPVQSVTDKPSLIKVSTLIGYGSPNKADTHDVHGAPLGASETAATREQLNWPYGEFEVRRRTAAPPHPLERCDVQRQSLGALGRCQSLVVDSDCSAAQLAAQAAGKQTAMLLWNSWGASAGGLHPAHPQRQQLPTIRQPSYSPCRTCALSLLQVPQEAYAEFAKGAQRGAEARKQWEEVRGTAGSSPARRASRAQALWLPAVRGASWDSMSLWLLPPGPPPPAPAPHPHPHHPHPNLTTTL